MVLATPRPPFRHDFSRVHMVNWLVEMAMRLERGNKVRICTALTPEEEQALHGSQIGFVLGNRIVVFCFSTLHPPRDMAQQGGGRNGAGWCLYIYIYKDVEMSNFLRC